jgi:hypothetical protein
MSVSCLPGLCPRSPPSYGSPLAGGGREGRAAVAVVLTDLTRDGLPTFVWKKVLVQPWQLPRYPSHTDHRQPVHDALSGEEPQGDPLLIHHRVSDVPSRRPLRRVLSFAHALCSSQSSPPLTSPHLASRLVYIRLAQLAAHHMMLSRIPPPRRNAQTFRASHHLLSGSQ